MDKTSSAFVEELRHALRRLYDPVYARKSPLLGLFGLEDEPSPAEGLRRVLKTAISALESDDCDPGLPGLLRCYQVLHYRYVQQFTQREVADQLHLSPRQLRREQSRAIEALAEVLRAQYELPDDVAKVLAADAEGQPTTQASAEVDGEMHWLGDSLAKEVADTAATAQEAVELAAMVAKRYPVRMETDLEQDLPPLGISATVLKQIMLNLMTPAIHSVASGGTVTLSASCDGPDVVIRVVARADVPAQWTVPEQDGLDMAERLAKLFEGGYQVMPADGLLDVRVSFTSVEQLHVLAIEDNLDTLQLWDRYVHGSRFQITGVRDPRCAMDTARALSPDLIILDVMMPDVDGWELLGQLANHPATSHIPIIVCTVLPQEELARALGASHFMRKPTTRSAFLAALAGQIEAAGRR